MSLYFMSMSKVLVVAVVVAGLTSELHASAQHITPANAAAKQAAEKEAARQAEIRRIEAYDKPLKTDHLGNGFIDGFVAGVVGGGVAAGKEVFTSTAQSVVEEKITDQFQSGGYSQPTYSSLPPAPEAPIGYLPITEPAPSGPQFTAPEE